MKTFVKPLVTLFTWAALGGAPMGFAADLPCQAPAPPVSEQARALEQVAKAIEPEKVDQWSLGPQDVRRAACRRGPPNASTVQNWLESQGSAPVKTLPFHGLTFEDEDPRLAALLDRLLSRKQGGFQVDFKERDDLDDCKKALCVAEKYFGETAPQLMYMLGKHGFNGSHLSFVNSSAWRADELASVLNSLEDLPPNALPGPGANQQLTHFARGKASLFDFEGRTIANSAIEFFDAWNKQEDRHRVALATHQLGNDFASRFKLAETPEWLALSGWQKEGRDWKASLPGALTSVASESGPIQDFGESFVAYRYRPEWLRRRSPEKYRFMKEVVFDGLEYTAESACQTSQSQSARVRALADAAVRDPEKLGKLDPYFYRCDKVLLRELSDTGTSPINRDSLNACLSRQIAMKIQKQAHADLPYARLMELTSTGPGIQPTNLDLRSLTPQVDAHLAGLKQRVTQAFVDRFERVFKGYVPNRRDPEWYYCRHVSYSKEGSPPYDKTDETQPLYFPDAESQAAVEGTLKKVCLETLKVKSNGPLTESEVRTGVDRWLITSPEADAQLVVTLSAPPAPPKPVERAQTVPTPSSGTPNSTGSPAPRSKPKPAPPRRGAATPPASPSYSLSPSVQTRICVTRSFAFGLLSRKSGDCD